MSMILRLLFFLLAISTFQGLNGQEANKRNACPISCMVYKTVIDSLGISNTAAFVLVDSTNNHYLINKKFRIFKKRPGNIPIGNSFFNKEWENFFDELDSENLQFDRIKVTEFQSAYIFKRVNVRELNEAFKSDILPWTGFGNVYKNAKGYVEVSNVQISKNGNKAIVVVKHTWDYLNSSTMLFFLEKNIDGKWVIIVTNELSVS